MATTEKKLKPWPPTLVSACHLHRPNLTFVPFRWWAMSPDVCYFCRYPEGPRGIWRRRGQRG